MRIDVRLPPGQIDRDLAALARRLPTVPGPLVPLVPPGHAPAHCAILWREVPSGVFVYVVPPDRQRLAGYVAFTRVRTPGTGRRGGDVFSPHAKFATDHQRHGLATCIYGWMLDTGACLLSGARQSEASHRLWRSLARSRPLGFAQVTGRALHYLGTEAPDTAFADLDTRLLLLGQGRTVDSVVRRAAAARGGHAPAGSVCSNS